MNLINQMKAWALMGDPAYVCLSMLKQKKKYLEEKKCKRNPEISSAFLTNQLVLIINCSLTSKKQKFENDKMPDMRTCSLHFADNFFFNLEIFFIIFIYNIQSQLMQLVIVCWLFKGFNQSNFKFYTTAVTTLTLSMFRNLYY